MTFVRTKRQRLADTLDATAKAPGGAFWEGTARDLMRKAAEELRQQDTDLRLTAQRAVDTTAREARLRAALAEMLAACLHWPDDAVANGGPITLTYSKPRVVREALAALRGEAPEPSP